MIKRTVEISAVPAYITVRDQQLLIVKRNPNTLCASRSVSAASIVGTVPLEDLGFVVVDQRDTTFSMAALAGMAESGAAVCICGPSHLPVGLLLAMSDRHETVWRIKDQIAIRKPTKKRLWRQIIRAKILAQSLNLPEESAAAHKLVALRQSVRSGDPDNVEAEAARIYWQHWLGDGLSFRRVSDQSRTGAAPNNLLDYGYAVIRAAVARAVVSAGLLPAIGIHHANRSNSFCLADDLLEPLRPIVDRQVRELFLSGVDTLSREAKEALLSLLTTEVSVPCPSDQRQRQTGPLMVSLHHYVASFVECIPVIGLRQRLAVPTVARKTPPP